MIQERVEQHYRIAKAKGYNVLGVFLQGSQNYNLHYEDSDIDTKAIVIPTFEDICFNKKPVSKTLILDNEEHIDLKDIRLMFSCFRKQNINFVEILFTKYKKLNPRYEHIWDKLIKNNEQIARYDIAKALNCIAGMSMDKKKALTHPYPTIKHKIDKFGYDPKQLHHIIRLYNFIQDYIICKPYSECLISSDIEYMIEVKKGNVFSLEEAKEKANNLTKQIKVFKDEYLNNNILEINENVDKILNRILIEVFTESFL